MSNILFHSEEHKCFFTEKISENGADVYYSPLVYLMGLTEETRGHFKDCFSEEERGINPAALEANWQTGTTDKITRLAFNLWNGWVSSPEEEAYTPYHLFCCEFAPFFYEAIKLRYPEYTRGGIE